MILPRVSFAPVLTSILYIEQSNFQEEKEKKKKKKEKE